MLRRDEKGNTCSLLSAAVVREAREAQQHLPPHLRIQFHTEGSHTGGPSLHNPAGPTDLRQITKRHGRTEKGLPCGGGKARQDSVLQDFQPQMAEMVMLDTSKQLYLHVFQKALKTANKYFTPIL